MLRAFSFRFLIESVEQEFPFKACCLKHVSLLLRHVVRNMFHSLEVRTMRGLPPGIPTGRNPHWTESPLNILIHALYYI